MTRTTSEPGSADSCEARPAMKQPRAFSTGEPSYLIAASTSGKVSPTALTAANESAGPFVTFRGTSTLCSRTLFCRRGSSYDHDLKVILGRACVHRHPDRRRPRYAGGPPVHQRRSDIHA